MVKLHTTITNNMNVITKHLIYFISNFTILIQHKWSL